MIDHADVIEAHRVLELRIEPGIGGVTPLTEMVDALPVFEIETMWHRGRFRRSLFAESPELSEAWRERYAVDGMPMLPPIVRRAPIMLDPWRWLARENGREEHKLQQRSGLAKPDFIRIREIAEQQDVLFRLPFWQAPGEVPHDDRLLYWSDPGALHWHLGLNERLLRNWERSPPDGPTPQEFKALKMPRETSWEGFAISCILRACGLRATGSIWRAPDGEIDLILTWSDTRRRWAVEVTLGRNKRLSPVFDLGCNITEAERGILIYNEQIGKPKVAWPKNFSRVVEVMTLADALREVRVGP